MLGASQSMKNELQNWPECSNANNNNNDAMAVAHYSLQESDKQNKNSLVTQEIYW